MEVHVHSEGLALAFTSLVRKLVRELASFLDS